MRTARIIVAIITALVLVGCTPPPGGPPPPGVPPPLPSPTASEQWRSWLEQRDGVTLLPSTTYSSFEFSRSYLVARADDVDAMRRLAGELDAANQGLPEREQLVVTVEVQLGEGISALRLVPGEISEAALAAASAPVPSAAALRLIGFAEPRYTDFHHQSPQSGFASKAHFFGADVLAILDEVEVPEGMKINVFGVPYDRYPSAEMDHLGDAYGSQAWSLDQLRGIVAAVRRAKAAGFEPTKINNENVWFDAPAKAVAVAEALPADTPVDLVGSDDGGKIIIAADQAIADVPDPGYRPYEYVSPTRAELIAYFKAHPDVTGGISVTWLELDFPTTRDCEDFLAAPPPWTSEMTITCVLDDGTRFGLTGSANDLQQRSPGVRAAAVAGEGSVVVMNHGSILLRVGNLDKMPEMFTLVRALGWEGQATISVDDWSSGERGDGMELTSTDTGKGEPQYPIVNDFQQRVMDDWDATATE